MAKIHIKQQHNLTHDQARERVEEIAKDLQKKLNAKYHWEGDSLRFTRSGASGHIDVGDGFIELDIKLGLVLTPMKSKIEQAVRQNIQVAITESDSGPKTA